MLGLSGDQIGGIIRAVAAAVMGIVAGRGYVSNEVATEIVGSVGTLGVALWSTYTNRPAKVIAKP